MDDKRLIIEVENHTILYDKSHSLFYDNGKKKIWREIALLLNVDGEYSFCNQTVLKSRPIQRLKTPRNLQIPIRLDIG